MCNSLFVVSNKPGTRNYNYIKNCLISLSERWFGVRRGWPVAFAKNMGILQISKELNQSVSGITTSGISTGLENNPLESAHVSVY